VQLFRTGRNSIGRRRLRPHDDGQREKSQR